MSKYKFNREQLKFVEDKRGIKGWIKIVLKYFIASLFLAVIYYFVFAFFVSTERERSLERETAIMEQEYEKLQQRAGVLDNTIKSLQQRDREIYRSIFNAEPPALATAREYDLFEGIDTTRMESIVKDSKTKLEVLEEGTKRINKSIEEIDLQMESLGKSITHIPSIIPIKDFAINQSGASVGKKVNPFYKTVVFHSGMDLLAATGTDVIAPADGVVEMVTKNGKKDGNTIVINHQNGYVTKYMTLGKISVWRRQKVNQGDVIAKVGSTGMSFAPHLHYEVWYNGEVMDPMNYFFATLTPEQFREMAIIVANTGQSMD